MSRPIPTAATAAGVSERSDSARTEHFSAATLAHGPATVPAPATAPRRRARPRKATLGEAAPVPRSRKAALEEAPVPLETPPHNGEYAGPAPVRVLPAGLSGEDVIEYARSRLVPGAVWRLAIQYDSDSTHRVRIEKYTGMIVHYLELDHARNRRKLHVNRFLREARPEPADRRRQPNQTRRVVR